ncbi:hypothetical protein BVC93_14660 [Mycobacterium sp. MS1601]|uniref:DUF4873 domain-containing protein n=1 Tax=Mycobacterium sp. MS1601 TaxID=1936029 RepID=UPI0009794806|nr:DUF4873 domain-containing protein [Mycobacterium sp. MS1601]AQA03444.1 hypothetical protein BVC93_14660 [Mycobacterium sp. MS1601]
MSAIVLRNDADRASFDEGSQTWTVTTADGTTESARVVIDARRSPDATVAVHGIPNHFRIPGPDVERQTRLVQRCLDLFERSGATRIEARSRIKAGGWRPVPLAQRFHLSGEVPDEDDGYDGPATVNGVEVRARLSGHLAAIDGQYHWRGTITGDLPADLRKGGRTVTLTIAEREVQARITETTPWGGYTVTGSGQPPFRP